MGVERKFVEELSIRNNNRVIIIGDEQNKDASFFPSSFNRPGHISKSHFRWFLDNFCQPVEKPIKDCIVSTYTYGELIHTMHYLGKVEDEDYIFEQNGLNGSFKTDKLAEKISGYAHKCFCI